MLILFFRKNNLYEISRGHFFTGCDCLLELAPVLKQVRYGSACDESNFCRCIFRFSDLADQLNVLQIDLGSVKLCVSNLSKIDLRSSST